MEMEGETTPQMRLAVLAIILESTQQAGAVNALLHEYESHIAARMGLPFRKRGVNIISVVVEASLDDINTLSGRLGRIPGVTAKAVFSRK